MPNDQRTGPNILTLCCSRIGRHHKKSLGFSPFELLYGWPVRGPMQILKQLWSKEIEDPEVRSTNQYVIEL